MQLTRGYLHLDVHGHIILVTSTHWPYFRIAPAADDTNSHKTKPNSIHLILLCLHPDFFWVNISTCTQV